MEASWVRKTSSNASPIPTEATASAAIPALMTWTSTSTPSAPTIAQTSTRTMPVATIASAVGVMPTRVSAHGAPR